jgi:hypothetical protein
MPKQLGPTEGRKAKTKIGPKSNRTATHHTKNQKTSPETFKGQKR